MKIDETIGWPRIRWIAHRCGGRLAPENSLAGLRAAAAAGCRAVEFDVMLSGEGSPWLIHDDNLSRTSFSEGEVGLLSDAQLAEVDISRGSDPAFRGERLPGFAEAMTLCASLRLLVNVEIKPYPGRETATGRRVAGDAVGAANRESVLLSSFSPAALAAAREVAPELPRALLFEQMSPDWRYAANDLAAVAIHCARTQDDWSWLPEAKALGLAVRAYTVNDAGEAARLFALGVDALFTDAVGELVREAG